jgi:putative serine protease PepD
MDEQNPHDQNDQSGDQSAGEHDMDDTHPVFGPSTPPDDGTTRPLPAYAPTPQHTWYGHTGPAETVTHPSRNRGLTAAVLVGALVLGGAAGVGGSAAFHAFQDDNPVSTSSGTTGKYQASSTALVKDGTVEKVASAVLPSVVKVNVSGQSGAGSGSGIILTKNGQILTNNHVVNAAGDNGTISVNFNDGTTKKATVVGTDPVTDIAVIKVDGVDNLTPASLGKSGALQVGQTVVAVGSPYGLNATVTSGIVSALNRPVSVSTAEEQAPQDPFGGPQGQGQASPNLSTTYPAIQTDAAINPGNSGGALVDMSGRVVGINSSIRTASDSASSDSGGSIGLGFAIPIDEVLPIVNQITDHQKPTHARLGVSVSDVSGNTLTQGAQLQSIETNGAGAKAGLKNGDVITKVDNEVIDGSESLVATIRGHRPGESVQITYLRGGKTHTTTASLGSDASTQDS